MRHFFKSAAIGFAMSALLSISPASALTVTAGPGATPLVLSGGPNRFDLNVLGYTVGSHVKMQRNAGSGLSIDGAASVIATYWGKEAGFNNFFNWKGSTLFKTNSSIVGATFTGTVNAGLLPFAFLSNGISALANGQGASGSASIAYALISPTEALLFFNDNCTCDADYDDMVVDLKFKASRGGNPSPVPVPAALPLLATGLLGFAGLRRRFKKS